MKTKQKTQTEILIAKYGLVGTIAAAVLSVLGTFLVAYLGYMGIRTQIERPIAATQTAEARPTQTPLPTSTPIQVTPTSTPLSADNVLRVETSWTGCPFKHALPEYIEPDLYPYTARDDFRQLLADETPADSYFPWAANMNWQGPYFSFTLTGLSSNQEWVILNKKLSIYVHRQEVPYHINIAKIGGCGGVLDLREFPEFYLESGHDTYMVDETYPDDTIAGFKLEPGEPEVFQIPFTCKAPGIYNLEVRMEVSYLGQKDEVRIAVPPITCPDTYTAWNVYETQIDDVTLSFDGKYTWNGSVYLPSPSLDAEPPSASASPSFEHVQFVNKCDRTILTAINYKNLDDQWVTDGWWSLEPEETADVANTRNTIFYFYAYSKDGQLTWEGTDLFEYVKSADKYGFRKYQMDIQNWGNFTFRLECNNP